MSTTVLLWDIDGTLLTTARAGVFALEAAFEEVTGRTASLQELKTSGLTDAEVVELALRTQGVEPDEATADRFLRAYEARLPGVLGFRDGHALPGVVDALETLSSRDDVLSLLLTGNTESGAAAKLEHYDLRRFFEAGGVFCTGPGSREEIAVRALARAAERLGEAPDLGRTFVIGDTPQDVRCGNAIGARTIAVASGVHPAEELAARGAWAVLEQIPEPAAFLELLGLDGR